jgi:hypothetical protein
MVRRLITASATVFKEFIIGAVGMMNVTGWNFGCGHCGIF